MIIFIKTRKYIYIEVSTHLILILLFNILYSLIHFSEIVDGNLKMTLGMIWTIILRFAIQDITVDGKIFYLNILNLFKINLKFPLLFWAVKICHSLYIIKESL